MRVNHYISRFLCAIVIALASFTLQAKQFSALLFTKTEGWHHPSVIQGVTAIKQLAELHHFHLDWQEDANYFNDDYLAKFDVIIFLQTTGNILNDTQQKAMQKFIQSGKGFVGIHSAADTEHDWPWYRQLVGRTFVIHPAVQTAKITVEEPTFSGTEYMPSKFLWTDEYYHFSDEHSNNLNYILSVDESSYEPSAAWGKLKVEGMGDFHPIAWYQHYDGGRSFYTGLGHHAAAYESDMFLQHIYGGIYWAAKSN